MTRPTTTSRSTACTATYAGCTNKTASTSYYIGYDNENIRALIDSDFSLDTFGCRLYGNRGDWLYEMEGGVQFGRQSGLGVDQKAGVRHGRHWPKISEHPWTPTVWFYYDYASGNAGGDDFNRFNQLFPLGHKYFGFIDAVQRSNIESPNVLLTMKPHKKWDLLMWYWYFMANRRRHRAQHGRHAGRKARRASHFGDELDLIAKKTISPRSNVLFGYSHFWRGDKILAPRDADFVYAQWELNF